MAKIVFKADAPPEQHLVYGEVQGHKGYYVSTDGRVWSCRPINGRGPLLPLESRRELRQSTQANGYKTVVLDRRTLSVHCLVLSTFDSLPKGRQCRHLNGNKAINCTDNLKWGTGVDQAHDRESHGTKLKGSKVGTSVLKEEQVLEAKKLSATFTYEELAIKYGVAKSTISHAISKTGNNWRHLWGN